MVTRSGSLEVSRRDEPSSSAGSDWVFTDTHEATGLSEDKFPDVLDFIPSEL